MAEFTIEITGEARDQIARELEASLVNASGEIQVYSETERDLDPTVIVSTVIVGLKAADAIWNWWQGRRQRQEPSGMHVIIRTARGRVVEISHVDQKQLEAILSEVD